MQLVRFLEISPKTQVKNKYKIPSVSQLSTMRKSEIKITPQRNIYKFSGILACVFKHYQNFNSLVITMPDIKSHISEIYD